MKKSELIAVLAALPDDPEILVEGYERGFDRIVMVRPEEVAFVRNADSWDGEFQTAEEICQMATINKRIGEAEPLSDPAFQAFVIVGRRGHRR